MEQKQNHEDMANSHALNIIKPFLVTIVDIAALQNTEEFETNSPKHEAMILKKQQDQALIKTFLSKQFPSVLELEAIKHLDKEPLLETDPWLVLEDLLLRNIDHVGTKEIFHIDFFLQSEPENVHLLRVKETIQKIDSARGLEFEGMVMIDINDDCKTLSKIFQFRTPQEEAQKKQLGLIALKSLYSTYKNHPEAQNLILGRLPFYKHHIMHLAKDFCEGTNMLPATDLNPFRLIVRGYRTEQEQQQIKEKQTV